MPGYDGGAVAPIHGGTESTMSDSPTNPDDPNLTSRYDPAPPPASVAPSPSAAAWRPRSDDSGRLGSVIFGVVLVAIGLWFFADQTLGLEMPRLRWSELWPVLIIALGGWIVLGSMRRGSR